MGNISFKINSSYNDEIYHEFKTKYIDNTYFENIMSVKKRICENKEAINSKIINSFNEACIKACEMQKEDRIGDIRYIYFSYLRTNLIKYSADYLIEFFDERWMYCKEECTGEFDMDFVYSDFFKTINNAKESKGKYGRFITDMDIEKIMIKEGDKYNNFAVDYIKNMILEIVDTDGYKKLKKSSKLQIFMGEYHDKVRVLYLDKN